MRTVSFHLILLSTFFIGVILFPIVPIMADETPGLSEIEKARQEGFAAGLAAGEYTSIQDSFSFSIPFAYYNGAMLYCNFYGDGAEWELNRHGLYTPGKTVVVTRENEGETIKLNVSDILKIILTSEIAPDFGPDAWTPGPSDPSHIYYLFYYRDVFKPNGDDISRTSTGEGAAVHEWTFISMARENGQLTMELHPSGWHENSTPADVFTINLEVE
ncbi:MAG: hypothetical protein GY859_20990 [Desulfobacterales bacterium]|nr:hypothetical protein [Desulfobacterales bacterium]